MRTVNGASGTGQANVSRFNIGATRSAMRRQRVRSFDGPDPNAELRSDVVQPREHVRQEHEADSWTYPNTIVKSGDRVTFDGVTYAVLDIGAGGDSEANSIWRIESPRPTAFLSDLTFNGTHAYVADGHLLAWLANLSLVERLCAGMDVVFPGHGPAGGPGKLIDAQRSYLLTLVAHVKELADGRTELSADDKAELERRMEAYLPNAGLKFLVAMNADPIARELNAAK